MSELNIQSSHDMCASPTELGPYLSPVSMSANVACACSPVLVIPCVVA